MQDDFTADQENRDPTLPELKSDDGDSWRLKSSAGQGKQARPCLKRHDDNVLAIPRARYRKQNSEGVAAPSTSQQPSQAASQTVQHSAADVEAYIKTLQLQLAARQRFMAALAATQPAQQHLAIQQSQQPQAFNSTGAGIGIGNSWQYAPMAFNGNVVVQGPAVQPLGPAVMAAPAPASTSELPANMPQPQ